MSTHCAIIEKIEGGQGHLYRGIYCHFDGYEKLGSGRWYLEGAGWVLKHYCNKEKDVSKLINMGNTQCISAPTQEKNFFQLAEENAKAWHDERGEPRPAPLYYGKTIKAVANQIPHSGYVWVFLNGKWSNYANRIKK